MTEALETSCLACVAWFVWLMYWVVAIMDADTKELAQGESVKVNITKYLSYTATAVLTHDGWGLKIECSRGPMIVRHMPDGLLSIGSAGPAEDDEV